MDKPKGAHSEGFDWMEPRRNPARKDLQRARREEMYRAELVERASLLHRLGHSREATRARLLANLEWDFPGGTGPVVPSALHGIIDGVFGPVGNSKAAPRGKGGTR